MKTFYLCDLVAKRVLSGGVLPPTFGNINGLEGLSTEQLADLSSHGSAGLAFLSHAAATAAGMDSATLGASHALVCQIAWDEIQLERDARRAGGFRVGNMWFHSKDTDRAQYTTFCSLAVERSLGAGVVLRPAWITMSGELIDMSVDLVRQVRNAGIDLENALFDSARAHKVAMEASADPLSYDYTAGWPARFGE